MRARPPLCPELPPLRRCGAGRGRGGLLLAGACEMADDTYDVFISYAPADRGWAQRLAADLSARGLRCFWDETPSPDDFPPDLLRDALERSEALVVIWSPAAQDSSTMLSAIDLFRGPGPLIPLVL